jgi:hypothetical protein
MQIEVPSVVSRSPQGESDVPHGRFAYARLLEALAEQWQISSPVYIRPTFWLHAGISLTFHFVLHRHGEVDLISVLDCPAVRQLVTEQALELDGT